MIENKKVKIIDSMMGKGKSSWAIQHMLKKQKEGERFIYVTPYLDEVKRVKDTCGFYEPEKGSDGKLASFKELLIQNKNVATTHALFKLLDEETLELLSIGYTLILDEVLDVVEENTIKKGDIDNMVDLGIIKYDENQNIVIGDEKIVKEKANEPNEYQTIAYNLIRNNLEILNGKKKVALIWLFPIDLINIFEEVYILTFMFDGYPMKGYLDAHKIQQEKYSVFCSNPEEEYENRIFKLTEYYYPKLEELDDLISIVQRGKINDIGEKSNTFTFSWWEKMIKNNNHNDWIVLRRNINNFLKTHCPSTSRKRIIWTAFTKCRSSLYSKSLTDDNFVANNIRATNIYKDRDIVIYLIDKRYNPVIARWFKSKNIEINEDTYALGEMIQCIWRSCIREGSGIQLYIPSKRMRKLLENFMNG